jgi:hypothetical protein
MVINKKAQPKNLGQRILARDPGARPKRRPFRARLMAAETGAIFNFFPVRQPLKRNKIGPAFTSG